MSGLCDDSDIHLLPWQADPAEQLSEGLDRFSEAYTIIRAVSASHRIWACPSVHVPSPNPKGLYYPTVDEMQSFFESVLAVAPDLYGFVWGPWRLGAGDVTLNVLTSQQEKVRQIHQGWYVKL